MKRIKSSKINAIDLSIILILLFLVVAAYLGTNSKKIEMMNIQKQSAAVVLKVEPEFSAIVENAKIGQHVILAESDISVGTITAVKKVYSRNLTIDENGLPYYKEDPDVYGYHVTLDTFIKKNDYGNYIDGVLFVAPGRQLVVNLEGSTVNFQSIVDSVIVK